MAWQRCCARARREGLPVVHDALARLPNRHEQPLSRPQAHGLRLVGSGGTLRPVFQQHSPSDASRRFFRSLMAMRWACEMTRQVSGSPRCGNCSQATCTASRSGTCSASTLRCCRKRKILSSLSSVLHERVQPVLGSNFFLSRPQTSDPRLCILTWPFLFSHRLGRGPRGKALHCTPD